MSDRHDGDCCRMCQFDKEDEDYNLEDDDGIQLCCCRALNDDGSVKPEAIEARRGQACSE